jgi:type II secretory pathway component PulF
LLDPSGVLVLVLFAVLEDACVSIKGWHRLLIGIPGIRDISRARFELQFFETLGSLLARRRSAAAGALELVRRAVTNRAPANMP